MRSQHTRGPIGKRGERRGIWQETTANTFRNTPPRLRITPRSNDRASAAPKTRRAVTGYYCAARFWGSYGKKIAVRRESGAFGPCPLLRDAYPGLLVQNHIICSLGEQSGPKAEQVVNQIWLTTCNDAVVRPEGYPRLRLREGACRARAPRPRPLAEVARATSLRSRPRGFESLRACSDLNEHEKGPFTGALSECSGAP